MRAEAASAVAESGLPQDGQIKQAFDQDHDRKMAHGFPGEQAAPGTRQEAMGESGADTAAVQIYDASFLTAREDHAVVKGVDALLVDEAGTPKQIEGKALSGEMTPQISAVGIAGAEFLDQGWIAHAALSEIQTRFLVVLELPLIKSGRLLQHSRNRLGGGRVSSLEVGEDRKSTRLNSSHLGISYAVF